MFITCLNRSKSKKSLSLAAVGKFDRHSRYIRSPVAMLEQVRAAEDSGNIISIDEDLELKLWQSKRNGGRNLKLDSEYTV
jgi:hypothetical protein